MMPLASSTNTIAIKSKPWLVLLLPILAVWGTLPFVETGLNDDWSFAFIALGLARTGHIVYNGWAAPMLLPQVWWGALLIRLFGFSFTLLRLSTLPFAAGCGWVLYEIGRRAGLSHALATFGALVLTLSPVFIPLAASFMTDVPALFFWLACFYCAVRAAGSPDPTRAALWLAAVAAAGFTGGAIRQVVWIAPFLVLPAVAWLRRAQHRLAVSAAVIWCATAAAAAACLRWYQAQPGHEPLRSQPWTQFLPALAEALRIMTLAALLAVLPVLLLFVTRWKRWTFPVLATLAAGGLLALCILGFEDDLLVGNMVTPNGILWQNSEALGTRPEILNAASLTALAIVLSLAAGFAAAWLAAQRPACPPALRYLLFFTVPSCALYIAAVAFRYTGDQILFDRYLIFVTPPLIIALLRFYQARIHPAPTLLAWGALALFALYGVASTHDYIASARARLQAASRLMASGVPRTSISAGLEFDGWTQLEETGRIPSREIRLRDSRKFPVPDPYWFWRMTPSITPRYILVYSPIEGLHNSEFPPLSYQAWLPPFQRQVLTQILP